MQWKKRWVEWLFSLLFCLLSVFVSKDLLSLLNSIQTVRLFSWTCSLKSLSAEGITWMCSDGANFDSLCGRFSRTWRGGYVRMFFECFSWFDLLFFSWFDAFLYDSCVCFMLLQNEGLNCTAILFIFLIGDGLNCVHCSD